MGLRKIFQTWWPLAASWLLMGTELPAVSAVIARLDNPEINLAAYGGIVFSLALIIEAPIIMMLAASTALSKDWDSYQKLRRLMNGISAVLTLIHILIAFTPLYDLVVRGLIGAPDEIVEPARIGLQIMTPWTWFIAYRRFNQGVLIRFGYSRVVGIGTGVRLLADISILAAGLFIGTIPGIVVGTSAVIAGVIIEAIYVGIRVQPILNNQLRQAAPPDTPLNFERILKFYAPLAMTSLLYLLANPMGSAAVSRMPDPLTSLAVWPVITGLAFMVRSLGIAYNEVVVALLDEPGSVTALRRFTRNLAFFSTLVLVIVAATPLSTIWFEGISGLSPNLASLAKNGIWVALIWPAANVFQSWFQGLILHSKQTRAVTEAVIIFLITASMILGFGVVQGQIRGLYVGLAAIVSGSVMQTLWLWYRSRSFFSSA
jgi:hypothetical protein